MTSPSSAPSTSEPINFGDTFSRTQAPTPTPTTSPTPDPDRRRPQHDPKPDRKPDHRRDHPEPGPGPPTRAVVSTTLPTPGARKQDYDDVAEVTTDIVIENTDLTSLTGAGWFPNLVLVTGNVQITKNAVPSTMDASIQKLDTVSGNLDIFGNDLLFVLGSAFPFPKDQGVGDRCVSIYNNPALFSLGSAFHGLDTMTGQCSVYGHAGHSIQQPRDGHWLLEHLR